VIVDLEGSTIVAAHPFLQPFEHRRGRTLRNAKSNLKRTIESDGIEMTVSEDRAKFVTVCHIGSVGSNGSEVNEHHIIEGMFKAEKGFGC
jgi:hypothetical protein